MRAAMLASLCLMGLARAATVDGGLGSLQTGAGVRIIF
jgi:hypothetical protein